MRWAPLFQLMIVPSSVLPITASSVESTIAARYSGAHPPRSLTSMNTTAGRTASSRGDTRSAELLRGGRGHSLKRQRHTEDAALVAARLEPDISTHARNDLAADVQAETDPAVRLRHARA